MSDRDVLHNYKELPENVKLFSVDGKPLMATHKGDIIYNNIKLHEVLFATEARFNVVSVSELDKQGLMTCIGGGKFTIYDVGGSKIVAEGYLNRENNEYPFSTMNWCLPNNERNQIALVAGGQPQEDPQDPEEEVWVIDSLCARHMVNALSMLSDVVVSESLSFTTAAGTIETEKKGHVSTENIVLSEVLYCPVILENVISVAELDKLNYSFTFYKRHCQIQSRDTLEDVGYGILDYEKNRYILKVFTGRRQPDFVPIESERNSKKRRTR